MFSFIPLGRDEYNFWQDRLYKIHSHEFYQFEPYFSIFSVAKNGSFYQHAVELVQLMGQFMEQNVTLGLSSYDVPLVCPIFIKSYYDFDPPTPTPFPYTKKPTYRWSVDGFAFNIHNNIWNTNYPLWYPFTEEDKTFKAQFEMMISIE